MVDKNTDVFSCFQETYISSAGKLPLLWRGNLHLTPGTGSSLGCLTLLSPHLNVLESIDLEGRAHVLAVQRCGGNNVSYIIANLYAPNVNNLTKITFLESVFDKVSELSEKYNCDNVIIAGDFNTILHKDEAKNRFYTNQE